MSRDDSVARVSFLAITNAVQREGAEAESVGGHNVGRLAFTASGAEPSTCALFLAGLVIVVLTRRPRRGA